MSLPIEDYALIGNMHTAALVGRNGSIDWLCVPRFDSPACFAALLGTSEHGRWLIAPQGRVKRVHQGYCDDTLILETVFETDEGEAALIDFMPIKQESGQLDLVRLVEGRRGSVQMQMELVLRFDYGAIVPWVKHVDGGWKAVAGPDTVLLHAPVEMNGDGLKTVANFSISDGETVPFILIRHNSELPIRKAKDVLRLRAEAEEGWRKWASRCTYDGPYRKELVRSLITIKALTYRPTGAIVAAPTTSLPEQLKGDLNWDYRYCWLRDASFTMCALLLAGYTEEASAWRDWLMRAVAGQAHKLQIMYGLFGERRLNELELRHLPGYEGSKPVRVGNAAYEQFQLDVYGEILNALYIAHSYNLTLNEDSWDIISVLLRYLEEAWEKPDDGIWETRTGPRHFTESKVAAWVAFDRGIKLIEHYNFEGPVERWRLVRDTIHAEVCERGFDTVRNTFVQHYGATDLDASLLRLPLVGFLPADDHRIVGTVDAIQKQLGSNNPLRRHSSSAKHKREGAFLPCTFWLVDCLLAMGRKAEARNIYDKLLSLCNAAGLLSEEYDNLKGRMLGNFPQALTHVTLIISAFNLSPEQKPMKLMRGEV